MVRSLQIEQEKRNGTAEREFVLSVYLCLVPVLESIAFWFLVPSFVAKLFFFTLPNQISIVIGGAVAGSVILFSILNAVRFAHHRLVRRWQFDIAIIGAIFVIDFALGEVYYTIFPLALNLGFFYNGFWYVLICPFWTILAVVQLMYHRMTKYRKWFDEHYTNRRWDETYYDYDA